MSTAPAEVILNLGHPPAETGPEAGAWSSNGGWSGDYDALDYEETLAEVAGRPADTLALYVHVPFCAGRCLYCGCNTTVTHDSARIDAYMDALFTEMAMVGERIDGARDVLQVHLAGGTPNYLSEAQLTRLVEMTERHFRIIPDTDLSIECDPRRASAGQLELLHALGFRGISFGVQDFDVDVQRAIGRLQSEELVRDVYWTARDIGFDHIGFDLIYGLPKQTVTSFERTIESVIDLAPDRIACFGYARQTAAGSHQHAIDAHELPDRRGREGIFRAAADGFTAAGYDWIGLDTFVLETDDLARAKAERRLHRNCIGYTISPSTHLVGLGPGAVGEIGGTCLQNQPLLELWQRELRAGTLPIGRGERLSDVERRRREAFSHLICNLELPEAMATGYLDAEYRRLASYVADGLVEITATGLRVTEAGRFLVRSLCSEHDACFHWDRARWHFSTSE
jgi:oxygen-independent coproporphyrinogen-3 oxidase